MYLHKIHIDLNVHMKVEDDKIPTRGVAHVTTRRSLPTNIVNVIILELS
jgi:hypothetical protein